MRPLLLSEKNHSALYEKVRGHLSEITDIYFKSQSMWELLIFSRLLEMYADIGRYNFNRKEPLSEDEHSLIYYEKFANLLKYTDSRFVQKAKGLAPMETRLADRVMVLRSRLMNHTKGLNH